MAIYTNQLQHAGISKSPTLWAGGVLNSIKCEAKAKRKALRSRTKAIDERAQDPLGAGLGPCLSHFPAPPGHHVWQRSRLSERMLRRTRREDAKKAKRRTILTISIRHDPAPRQLYFIQSKHPIEETPMGEKIRLTASDGHELGAYCAIDWPIRAF